MNEPTISVLEQDEYRTRYRIEGGDLSGTWTARPGRVAWCEIMVSWEPPRGSNRPRDTVGSYGGEVWPTAWGRLFEALPNSVILGGGRIRITPAGMDALAAARRRFAHDTTQGVIRRSSPRRAR